ncbi:hypothetical protein HaLaN_15023, partial [Haematococcus lacustris]
MQARPGLLAALLRAPQPATLLWAREVVWEQQLLPRLHLLGPQELSTVAWALAKLGRPTYPPQEQPWRLGEGQARVPLGVQEGGGGRQVLLIGRGPAKGVEVSRVSGEGPELGSEQQGGGGGGVQQPVDKRLAAWLQQALYQRPVQRLSDHSLSLVVYGLGRMGAQVDGQWLAACLEELADAYTALVDLEPQLAAVWGDNFEQLLPKGQLQAAG